MKHLYKLAFILVIGTGLALAQTTPSTSPSGAQTPDNSQMGQKGAGSASAVSDIQSALHKQLPNVADNVTVSTTDDNKVQLAGTVSSDAEKQQVEQIARSAAPSSDIVNKLTVGSSAPGNEPSSQPPASKPPKVQLIAYQAGSASQTPSSQTSPSSQTPSSQTPSSQTPSSQAPSSQTPSSPAPSSQAPSTEQPGNMSQTSQAGGSDVQDKIQKAIQQDSSLSGANVNVSVSGDKVELTGTVASKDQKKTVKQIAESNAGGMKIVDHVKVEGKGSATSPETPKN